MCFEDEKCVLLFLWHRRLSVMKNIMSPELPSLTCDHDDDDRCLGDRVKIKFGWTIQICY
jgi:hypothetical protein